MLPPYKAPRSLRSDNVHAFVESVVGGDLHAKRVISLSSCVVGVIHSASLAVSTIGRALGQAQDLHPKHGIKQVDRLLSNRGIDVPDLFEKWVAYVVASRPEIVVALDWTDFDRDGQSTLVASMVTTHGRATPLVWKTVNKSELKGNRNEVEDALVTLLRYVVPTHVRVTLLADRGFGDADFYAYQSAIGLGHIIRFKGNITVTDAAGVSKPARDWLAAEGKARIMRNVLVTNRKKPVDAVVCVWQRGMKEAWFLACNGDVAKQTASQIVKLYGKRFTIEENFRDVKDPRFGMGLSSARVNSPQRRDRLLLVSALAVALLTLLGAASEAIGYDRMLRANTVKKRTHSLFNQGCYYYGAIPNMRQERLEPLMQKFGEMLNEQPVFQQLFGVL
jgi:Transposase DDE domain